MIHPPDAHRTSRLLPAILLALSVATVLYLNFFVLVFQPHTDDLFFSDALEQRDVGDYLWHRYERWTGRIPIEAVLVLIANHLAAWKLVNSLMLLLLCYSAGRIGFGSRLNPLLATSLVFCLLMLLPAPVLAGAAWWMTGSVNYLWPVALACYGMLQFFDRHQTNAVHRASFVLAGGLSVYNEQVALVSLCVLMPMHAWLVWRGESTRWDKAHAAFMVPNLLVAATAPGNANRFMEEQVTWFPGFDQLSFSEKLGNGLDLVASGLITPGNHLALVAAIAAAMVIARRPAPMAGRMVLLAGLAYIAGIHVFQLLPMPSLVARMYSVTQISAANAAWPMVYVVMAASVCAIVCLVFAQVRAFEERPAQALLAGWALAAGLASVVAMGWSPTVHASGSRTLFVSGVVLVIVTSRMGMKLRAIYGSRLATAGTVCVVILAAWRVLDFAS